MSALQFPDEVEGLRRRRDGARAMWVAVALSLLLHGALLWHWLPQLHLLSLTDSEPDRLPPSLVIELAAPQRAAPAARAAPAPRVAAVRPAPPAPRARPSAPPAPPVVALNAPAPATAPAPPDTPPATVPAPGAAGGDLSSYIEAQRRARAEPAAPSTPSTPSAGATLSAAQSADDAARANRIVIANLAAQGPVTFGYDPAKSGGVFMLKHVGYEEAEFTFYGWNKDVGRNTAQPIEVHRGGASDIRIAVVRKMITIIREYEQQDFLWQSQRLGRNITLSARARDNAGLEEFMMQEFFPEGRMPR